VCLGDSICRILEYSGFDVMPVNYIGDEGTHVAKCLWSVERYSGLKPEKNFSEWYGKRYSETHEKLEQAQGELKTAMQGEISHILSCLESKSGKYFQMWQQSRKQCLEDFDHIYEWLNVPFSHIFYESEVSEESQAIVEEYINKGLFTKSDGAYGVSLEPYGLGYFMARKSDGTSLYITKDLALAKTKFEKFNIDRSIYVVGSEQNFHFRQLFKTLELMGFQQAKQCFHLSYAHVTLPEGKISSRRGNAIPFWKLASLLESEFDVHLEKYVDVWPKTELESTRKKLAIAAIKYGMLSADPQKEIVFDPKIWTSFDGNSGPYLMYTYARTSSILKECMQRGYQANFSNFELLTEQYEYEILRHIYDFNGVVRHSGETYKPSVIANYLFSLCKSFNRFYANLSVLKADDDRVRDVRMALLIGFSETLKEGLKLLGIPTVDRM
jgi:arginyl-tRNA synthetase